MQTGRQQQALGYFERILKKDPLDHEVNWLAFDCLKADSRIEDAMAQLKRMATFPYEDYRVYREMGMLYLNEYNQPEMGRRMFAKSLQLNPEQPELSALLAKKSPETDETDPNKALSPESFLPKDLMPNLPGMDLPTPELPQLPQMPGVPGAPGGQAPGGVPTP